MYSTGAINVKEDTAVTLQVATDLDGESQETAVFVVINSSARYLGY